MSGSIGGNRIRRANVQPTVDWYEQNVLAGFRGYNKHEITGSYNAGTKSDHGDIDLCVWVSGSDIRAVKKEFKSYIESLPDDVAVPFRTGRNKGKKAQLYGSIVTCQIPIIGDDGNYVQVDNIIVLTAEELRFQKSFLNLNAQVQTICTALVRIMPDSKKQQAFKFLGIQELPDLQSNQEYEFVLSTAALSLRKVTLSDEKKTLKKEEIWRSFNWDNVEKLLSISLNGWNPKGKTYEEILDQAAAVYKNDDRAKRRLCGIMRSMINIGPGEVGTPKGEAKQRGIDMAYQVLGVTESRDLKSHLRRRLIHEDFT